MNRQTTPAQDAATAFLLSALGVVAFMGLEYRFDSFVASIAIVGLATVGTWLSRR